MSDLANSHTEENYLDDVALPALLQGYKNVAIVGVSNKEDRPSNGVARYLVDHTNLEVYFVNPLLQELWGRKVYSSLTELHEALGSEVDIVDIFRKSEDIPPVAEEAIAIGVKMIWMQLGISNREAAEWSRSEGIEVVQNKCIKIEYEKFYQRGLLERAQ